MKIILDLDDETAAYLRVLGRSNAMGGKGSPKDVVDHLVHSAVDGVRRPGSWERQWLAPAFGDGWQDYTESHPTVGYRVVPREVPGEPPPEPSLKGALALDVKEWTRALVVTRATAKLPDGRTIDLPPMTEIVEPADPERSPTP